MKAPTTRELSFLSHHLCHMLQVHPRPTDKVVYLEIEAGDTVAGALRRAQAPNAAPALDPWVCALIASHLSRLTSGPTQEEK
jgi:hypothetical protein